MQADEDVVEHAQRAEHLRVLERARDAAARDRVRREIEQALAGERHAAGIRPVEPGEDVEDGGLAGAVGPDQPEDLALRHLEAHVGERRQPAEADGEILDAQQRHAASPT